jgi:Xaa-Pro aminopeptidase
VQDFVSLSFNTISAVGAHAGFPHYHPTEESGKVLIDPNNVYLIDSGGTSKLTN